MLELIRQSNKAERYLFAGNVAAALVNVALAFLDGWATFLNWFVAGVCSAMAGNLIFMIRWRLLFERQDVVIQQANGFIKVLLSPNHYERQLRLIMEQAKRDGVLPPDVDLFKIDQPKLH